MNISHVGRVCVTTADPDQALAFYTEKLGFEKLVDLPFGNGYRWIEVAPAGGKTTIAIAPPPDGKPAGGTETGIILDSSDIDADYAELRDKGIDVDAEITRMGDPVPPMFWFRDPDKNSLMIVQAAVA
jgi:catechol 2,3-dioxygenase-like lactoylglutathione lyase family enzyme